MTDKQETNHAVARSRSNDGLGVNGMKPTNAAFVAVIQNRLPTISNPTFRTNERTPEEVAKLKKAIMKAAVRIYLRCQGGVRNFV